MICWPEFSHLLSLAGVIQLDQLQNTSVKKRNDLLVFLGVAPLTSRCGTAKTNRKLLLPLRALRLCKPALHSSLTQGVVNSRGPVVSVLLVPSGLCSCKFDNTYKLSLI